MDQISRPSPSNRLIATLPSSEKDVLRDLLERCDIDARMIIEEPGKPYPYIYFPESGLISVVARNAAEEKIEVGIIGAEGMTGLSILHGADRSPHSTFVQIAGSANRIPTGVLAGLIEERPAMKAHFLLYAQAYMIQIAHTVLANGRYTLDERLARWLLMCHDRMVDDDIPLTHEYLSIMLGVRRPGVTTALHMLEGSRIVRARRSRIVVIDRNELENSAGGSYGSPEAEYRRLLGVGHSVRYPEDAPADAGAAG